MEKKYNITEFSKLLNVKVKTLQKWDRDGVLKAYRTPTNRRFYLQSQYDNIIGKDSIESNDSRYGVAYCRVSNSNQKDDLKNQIKYVEKYIEKNELSINKIYSEIGSGLNFKRKKWNKIIDKCIKGKISFIIISYKDRFVRFGFDWFKDFLKKNYDVDIIVIRDEKKSPQEELVEDLISIIHVFSCRIYGLRKYKKEIKKDLLENEEDL